MSEPTLPSTSDQTGAQEARQAPLPRIPTRAERVQAAMGKFAWVPFSSDDYVREKQEEIELEERRSAQW